MNLKEYEYLVLNEVYHLRSLIEGNTFNIVFFFHLSLLLKIFQNLSVSSPAPVTID